MILNRLASLFDRRAAQATIERFFTEIFPPTTSGVTVSEENALQYAAVYSAIRVLADTVAAIPLNIYRSLPGDAKERARTHYLFDLLHRKPNPEMSAADWQSLIMVNLNTWGNSYHEIERNAGRVVALWPRKPDKIKAKRREGGALYYEHRLSDGSKREIPADRMLHISGLTLDGIQGLSPIGYHKEAIGLGIATERFGAAFFGNGARPTTILKHPGELGPQSAARMKKDWEEVQKGLANAHRTAVLEEGMDIEVIGIPPNEAQFLQTRQFQVTEIARIFRVPPHMIADMEHATFTNIEHQGIEFVKYSIMPWLLRIEQAIENQVFTQAERAEFFAEFLVDGLLRGDTATRYQAYSTGRQWGWLSANDVRRFENMNPIDGGDEYLVPLNMVPAGRAGEIPQSTDTGDDTQRALDDTQRALPLPRMESRSKRSLAGRQRIAGAHIGLFEDAATRVIRREKADVMREAEKRLRDLEGFMIWLESFYKRHEAFVDRNMKPAMLALAGEIHAEAAEEIGGDTAITARVESFVGLYLAAFIRRHIGSSIGQIKSVVGNAEAAGEDGVLALRTRFEEWEEKRPRKIARWETVQASSAVAREVYRENGRTQIRWHAFGDTCPYCRSLDGRVIAIEGVFISSGEEFQPEGVDKPLTTHTDIGHPPAHAGCDCSISAV